MNHNKQSQKHMQLQTTPYRPPSGRLVTNNKSQAVR